jgi:hypothetical protein
MHIAEYARLGCGSVVLRRVQINPFRASSSGSPTKDNE